MQILAVWLAFGNRPAEAERAVVTVLWVVAVIQLLFLSARLLVHHAEGTLHFQTTTEYARLLIQISGWGPLRLLLYGAFLVALHVDGRPALLALHLVAFGLALAQRAQPRANAENGRQPAPGAPVTPPQGLPGTLIA